MLLLKCQSSFSKIKNLFFFLFQLITAWQEDGCSGTNTPTGFWGVKSSSSSDCPSCLGFQLYWSKQLHPSSQFLSFSIHPIAVPMAKRPVRACNSCRRTNLSLHSHQSITTHVHSDPKPPPAVQVWTDLQNPFPTYHRKRDSWKITLRGWSPTINQTLPGPTRSPWAPHPQESNPSRYGDFILMGGYSFPDVNWEHCTAGTNRFRRFLQHLGDDFLVQTLRELTEMPSLLCCLLTETGPWGKGALGAVLATVITNPSSLKISVDSEQKHQQNFNPGHDFRLLREVEGKVPWEKVFTGTAVHQCWSLFKHHLLRAQEQGIPQMSEVKQTR